MLGSGHPDTLKSMNYLGLVLMAKGVFAAAELLLSEALEGQHEHDLSSRQPHTVLPVHI